MGAAEQKRMQQPALPMPMFPRDTTVKVFMGAGWAKGSVQHSDKDGCTVWLLQLRRTTRCRDARNIQRAS